MNKFELLENTKSLYDKSVKWITNKVEKVAIIEHHPITNQRSIIGFGYSDLEMYKSIEAMSYKIVTESTIEINEGASKIRKPLGGFLIST